MDLSADRGTKGGCIGGIDHIKLAHNTEKLKQLIAEHPDYPIVVLAGEEANGGDYAWMFCSDVSFAVDEILDTDYYDHDDTVFTDRDRLEEYIEDMLYDEYSEKPQEEYDRAIKAKVAELEPFWVKVIAIYASN